MTTFSRLLASLAFAGIAAPLAVSQGIRWSFEYVGPGCGAAYAFPQVTPGPNASFTWYQSDPNAWQPYSTVPSIAIVAVGPYALPAPIALPLQYFPTPCNLLIDPIHWWFMPPPPATQPNWYTMSIAMLRVPIPPNVYDTYVQGFFFCASSGLSPLYLSATPAWRVQASGP
jgi:hypothetical protein